MQVGVNTGNIFSTLTNAASWKFVSLVFRLAPGTPLPRTWKPERILPTDQSTDVSMFKLVVKLQELLCAGLPARERYSLQAMWEWLRRAELRLSVLSRSRTRSVSCCWWVGGMEETLSHTHMLLF